MRVGYTICPEGQTILKNHGINARIAKIKGKKRAPFNEELYASECQELMNDMIRTNHFRNFPKTHLAAFAEKYNAFYKSLDFSLDPEVKAERNAFDWHLTREGKTIDEIVQPIDLVLLSGFAAASVLSKSELWDYQKFGLKSPIALTGLVGAAIFEAFKKAPEDEKDGYIWTTTHADGVVLSTNFVPNAHSDFHIFQDNYAPFNTIDPFGNDVAYNPIPRRTLPAYHSEERNLLVMALKYLETIGKLKEFENKHLAQLQKYGSRLKQDSGKAVPMGVDLKIPFVSSTIGTMPTIDSDGTVSEDYSCAHLASFCGGDFTYFDGYVAENKDLVISERPKSADVKKRDVLLRFNSVDMYQVIKGILTHSARGHGRMSAEEMLQMLNYRFSEQFKMDYKLK